MKKSIILGIVTLAMAAVLTGCGRSGKVLAKVNDDTITEDDLNYALDMARTVRVVTPDGQKVEAQVDGRLGYQLLQEIIKRKLTIQLAQDDGVAPTEKDIDEEIKFQTNLDPNFMKNQNAAGIVLSRTREDLRYRLALDGLLTKDIKVTPEDVEKIIKENPKQFMEPETANLRWILLPGTGKEVEATKAQIDAEFLGGQTFKTLAGQYSKAPDAGASYGMFPINQVERMPEVVKNFVKKNPVNRASSWIQSQEGWAKFYIESKQPAKPINMTSTRKEWVRRQIALTRGRQAKDINARIADKLEKSEKKIKIENNALQKLWEDDFKNFLKAQKESNAKSAGSSDVSSPKTK